MNHPTPHENALHSFEFKGIVSAILSAISWLCKYSNAMPLASFVLTMLSIVFVSWNLYDKWKASKTIIQTPKPDVDVHEKNS
jgi:hypothetical protein